MILKVNSQTPQPRFIERAVRILKDGGIIIYPTDTIYAIGCDIMNKKAVERVYQIKGATPGKDLFSCVCEHVSIIGDYAVNVTTPLYRLLRTAWPGPYTFILKASKKIPRHFQSRRRTIGIRVTENPITQALVEALGNPLLSTSLPPAERSEFYTNPELIHERYRNLVDLVIDGGTGEVVPSTVIDVSEGDDNIKVLRIGKGDLSTLNLELHENPE